MNNLYGWAMSDYLPYGGFKWLKSVDNFDVNSISGCNSIKKSPIGYIYEVDLEDPDELHVLHSELFSPRKTYNSLSHAVRLL